MRKIWILIVSVVLILSCAPLAASAAEYTKSTGVPTFVGKGLGNRSGGGISLSRVNGWINYGPSEGGVHGTRGSRAVSGTGAGQKKGDRE